MLGFNLPVIILEGLLQLQDVIHEVLVGQELLGHVRAHARESVGAVEGHEEGAHGERGVELRVLRDDLQRVTHVSGDQFHARTVHAGLSICLDEVLQNAAIIKYSVLAGVGTNDIKHLGSQADIFAQPCRPW